MSALIIKFIGELCINIVKSLEILLTYNLKPNVLQITGPNQYNYFKYW